MCWKLDLPDSNRGESHTCTPESEPRLEPHWGTRRAFLLCMFARRGRGLSQLAADRSVSSPSGPGRVPEPREMILRHKGERCLNSNRIPIGSGGHARAGANAPGSCGNTRPRTCTPSHSAQKLEPACSPGRSKVRTSQAEGGARLPAHLGGGFANGIRPLLSFSGVRFVGLPSL